MFLKIEKRDKWWWVKWKPWILFYLVIYWTQKVLQNVMDNMMCWFMIHIQMCSYFIHCYVVISFMMASTAAMVSGVTTLCAWSGQGESVTELIPFMNFLVHLYTCCSDRHASPYWTFVNEFRSVSPLQNAVLLWCMLQARPPFFTTTAPSCFIPASYCHLSATLQTMSTNVVKLQDNRAVFLIFIALLRFAFDPPSYKSEFNALIGRSRGGWISWVTYP
jgi:hypothetical protein